MEHKFNDYFHHYNSSGCKELRCSECQDHGENIDSRGDCKNLIKMPDGSYYQCQCYSIEHK